MIEHTVLREPVIIKRVADKHSLKEHFNKLSEEDKYLRFGYMIKNDAVDKYIDSTYLSTNHVWYAVHFEGRIIATSHVIIDTNNSLSEFGLTVDQYYRGRGIAKKLFAASLELCKEHKIKKIILFCLAQNMVMRHIAKQFGSVATNASDVTESHINLEYA